MFITLQLVNTRTHRPHCTIDQIDGASQTHHYPAPTNLTIRIVVGLDITCRDPPPFPRRRSNLFCLASRASRALHSLTCCFRRCCLAAAMAGVGLKPIPLIPSPSSSPLGSISCPVISSSCHVSAAWSGVRSPFDGKGEAERIVSCEVSGDVGEVLGGGVVWNGS